MRKGFKWLIAGLALAFVVALVYPIVGGWFVMM